MIGGILGNFLSDEDDAAAAISSVEDKKNLQKNMTDVVIVTDPPPPPLATATAGKTAASVQSSTTGSVTEHDLFLVAIFHHMVYFLTCDWFSVSRNFGMFLRLFNLSQIAIR